MSNISHKKLYPLRRLIYGRLPAGRQVFGRPVSNGMKKIFTAFILIIALGISAKLVVSSVELSFAQSVPAAPKIFLTWRANTYIPSGFSGKAMPTAGSQIIASAELIDNGKTVDLSKQNVYWYQDNNFIAGGYGLQTATFRAPDVAGGTIDIRVEFPNYSKGAQLKTITVPIVRPEAIIESPSPDGKFSSSPIQLFGQPYFFNANTISKLNFNWTVNGQIPSGAENPQNLNIKFNSMSPDSALSVSLSIQNTDNRYQLEGASQNINLTYSQ